MMAEDLNAHFYSATDTLRCEITSPREEHGYERRLVQPCSRLDWPVCSKQGSNTERD